MNTRNKNNILNNYLKWKMLVDLVVNSSELPKRDSNNIYVSDLISLLQTGRSNPYFIDILWLLKESNIIKVKDTIGKTQVIEIDFKKLEKLLESSDIYQTFAKYVYKTRLIYIDI